MAFEDLSDREKQILANLITYYVRSADPVGSRVIANKFKMGISSATIRNTLADLEELGLVEQPHTSAGRVPTDLGYRVYVDYLLKPHELTPAEQEYIKSGVLSAGRGIRDILGQTTRVLGEITNQLGVALSPQFEEGRLRGINLISVSDERVMVVVIVQSGLARSVVIEVETTLSDQELQQYEQVLNERLCGLTLGEIRESLAERLSDVKGKGRLLRLLVDSKDQIWTDKQAGKIRVAGMDNLLIQPEFADRDRLCGLLKLMEDQGELSDFLAAAREAGLVITIGRENKFTDVMNCSLVSSSYRVGKISGTVGVFGPTRMPYSKLVSVVEYTARTITDALSGMDTDRDNN